MPIISRTIRTLVAVSALAVWMVDDILHKRIKYK